MTTRKMKPVERERVKKRKEKKEGVRENSIWTGMVYYYYCMIVLVPKRKNQEEMRKLFTSILICHVEITKLSDFVIWQYFLGNSIFFFEFLAKQLHFYDKTHFEFDSWKLRPSHWYMTVELMSLSLS